MTIQNVDLRRFVTSGCLFIETGTEVGDTVRRALEYGAAHVITCEMDSALAAERAAEFGDRLDVSLWHENSGLVIGKMMLAAHEMRERAERESGARPQIVVWLDAHSSAASPLLQEIHGIGQSGVIPDVLLIDDMRYVRSRFWGFGLWDLDQALGLAYPLGHTEECIDGHRDPKNGVQVNDILVVRPK